MLDALLSLAAPHHCFGCSQIGTLLCDNCKYDIISEPFLTCVACGNGIGGANGMCSACKVPYGRAWCIAPRREHLQQLIDDYKFANVRSAYRTLGDLLDSHLPLLLANVRIVPIPTVPSHIRQRGYDHTLLIARHLGRLRGLPIDTSLVRVTNTMQRGNKAPQRKEQAKRAFACRKQLNSEAIYLLIDDVMTTGSTMRYAAKTLQDAGASTVWVATISRQTLD